MDRASREQWRFSDDARENVDIVRQWVEQVWNDGDLARIVDFHAANFENDGRPATPDEASQ